VDLARRLEAEFNVKLRERTVGAYLAKLGFRRLSVRPEHPNADPAAQATSKKTLPVS
jgi:transposase